MKFAVCFFAFFFVAASAAPPAPPEAENDRWPLSDSDDGEDSAAIEQSFEFVDEALGLERDAAPSPPLVFCCFPPFATVILLAFRTNDDAASSAGVRVSRACDSVSTPFAPAIIHPGADGTGHLFHDARAARAIATRTNVPNPAAASTASVASAASALGREHPSAGAASACAAASSSCSGRRAARDLFGPARPGNPRIGRSVGNTASPSVRRGTCF